MRDEEVMERFGKATKTLEKYANTSVVILIIIIVAILVTIYVLNKIEHCSESARKKKIGPLN
jgi:hypothetical protein